MTVGAISEGIKIMGNSVKYTAMAIAGTGIAIAAATPASACFDWGYTGVQSYGWAYANTGFSNSPVNSYRSCGGTYHIQGWGECGGYGHCGWAPFPALVVTVPVEDAAAPAKRVTRASRWRVRKAAQSAEPYLPAGVSTVVGS
jgi:hypothetical protein